MQRCPKCKSKNFKADARIKKPTRVTGVQKFNTVTYRYYICQSVGCGHRFVTRETYDHKVRSSQGELQLS